MLCNSYNNQNKKILFSYSIISFILDEDFWSYLSLNLIYDLVEMLSLIEYSYLNFFDSINHYINSIYVNNMYSLYFYFNSMEDYSYEYVYVIIKSFLLSHFSFSYNKCYYLNSNILTSHNLFHNTTSSYSQYLSLFFEKKNHFIKKKYINLYFHNYTRFIHINRSYNYRMFYKYIQFISWLIKNPFPLKKDFFFYKKSFFLKKNFYFLYFTKSLSCINIINNNNIGFLFLDNSINLFSSIFSYNSRFIYNILNYSVYCIINNFYYNKLIKSKYLLLDKLIYKNHDFFYNYSTNKYKKLHSTIRFYKLHSIYSTNIINHI